MKTGRPSALSPRIASPSAASAVSAPSLTITRPGDRQTGELLPHARQRRAEARLRSAEGQIALLRRARRRAREAEGAHGEAFGQRLEQAAIVGAEFALHERGARLAVDIRDLHAARIVEQHAEKVLLRHRGPHDQQRPEHADQDDGENGEADRRERDALAPARPWPVR